MNNNKKYKFMPLLLAVCIVLGIIIGNFYAKHASGNRLNIIGAGSNRLQNLLQIIDDQYVDTININDLVEGAIPNILAELDPHSVYISAKDVEAANDDLKGSFSGIGIEFTIREDTIRVQNVIKNGPSEKAGIIAGDKIISIDGKPFVGKIVTDDEAKRRLKGKKDTKVRLGILRYGNKQPIYITVTRADIQMKSISAAYMIDKTIGYLKIKSFGETTYQELLASMQKLSRDGVENLIIDLRDNVGGFMNSAVEIANEFLPANKMIVYTQGRKFPREDYRSNGRGTYQSIPLVVLINEGTASAAEIFAGAIQDNDRGTVIGRRSFGKGLVQRPIMFSDGSMIRLTIARYYTPSGRCIQKPYNRNDNLSYEEDLIARYQHGEYFNADSIKHTGPTYHTSIGRNVYGGGGITPDIFIPEDTTSYTSYYKEAVMSGLLLLYAFDYTDNNRQQLKKFSTMQPLLNEIKRYNLVDKFATYAEQKGLRRRNLLIQKSHNLLQRFIYSRIIYNMLDEEAWVEYINMSDPTIEKAIEVFNKKEAFPKKK